MPINLTRLLRVWNETDAVLFKRVALVSVAAELERQGLRHWEEEK